MTVPPCRSESSVLRAFWERWNDDKTATTFPLQCSSDELEIIIEYYRTFPPPHTSESEEDSRVVSAAETVFDKKLKKLSLAAFFKLLEIIDYLQFDRMRKHMTAIVADEIKGALSSALIFRMRSTAPR